MMFEPVEIVEPTAKHQGSVIFLHGAGMEHDYYVLLSFICF